MEIKQAVGTTSAVYQDAFQIRMNVFVVEQQVPQDLELDEYDPIANNYVGYVSGQPVTTARTLTHGDRWHIQRVATIKAARHHGYAAELMRTIIAAAIADQSVNVLELGAQLQAIPFYERLGFTAHGAEFLDAGIRHRHMELTVSGEV